MFPLFQLSMSSIVNRGDTDTYYYQGLTLASFGTSPNTEYYYKVHKGVQARTLLCSRAICFLLKEAHLQNNNLNAAAFSYYVNKCTIQTQKKQVKSACLTSANRMQPHYDMWTYCSL